MKAWKKMLAAVTLLVLVGTFAPSAWSLDMNLNPEAADGYENLWNRITRKLGRGITNAGFGALEVPIRIAEVNFNEGGLAACTYGVLSGVGYFVLREVVGVVEVVTFPFPLPGCSEQPYGYGAGYGPILTPEWIITQETNYYNFVFTRSSFVD